MKSNNKFIQSITSVFIALVMCIGFFSVTCFAQEVTNFDLTYNVRLYNTAYSDVRIDETVYKTNNDQFTYEWRANDVGLNYGTSVSLSTLIVKDDNTIIAKAGETFKFRIDNIRMTFAMDNTYFEWDNSEKTYRQIALHHSDGTITYLYDGIDWNYTTGNDTHYISVNITSQKDVKEIVYYESVCITDLVDLPINTYYDNITIFGSFDYPLNVIVDIQSKESVLLEGIENQIGNAISGTPQQNQQVDDAIGGLTGKTDDLDALGDQMSSVDKPTIDSNKISADSLVPHTALVALSSPFQALWENNQLLAILTIVVTLVLVSWVFFGKKG